MNSPHHFLCGHLLLAGLLTACGGPATYETGPVGDVESPETGPEDALGVVTPDTTNTGSSDSSVAFLTTVFPDEASWESVFVVAHTNANCNGKEILSRAHFLEAAGKYPGFCGSDSDAVNVRELAAFLANVSLETNGAAAGETNGGLCFASEVGCDAEGASCDYCSGLTAPWNTAPPQCPFGYYGRGALQITNPKNYHDTSMLVFGDDRLYQNPDAILEGATAWEASLAFWSGVEGGLASSATSVQGRTTCHEAIVDSGDFGKTVEVINGNLECGNPGAAFVAKTAKRVAYYKAYLALFYNRLGLFAPAGVSKTSCASEGGAAADTNATRCGSEWSEADSTCGDSCTTVDDCENPGESCFADLSLEPCGLQ
ncbi:MAG: chitinase [Polyangiaceae bacterium]